MMMKGYMTRGDNCWRKCEEETQRLPVVEAVVAKLATGHHKSAFAFWTPFSEG